MALISPKMLIWVIQPTSYIAIGVQNKKTLVKIDKIENIEKQKDSPIQYD